MELTDQDIKKNATYWQARLKYAQEWAERNQAVLCDQERIEADRKKYGNLQSAAEIYLGFALDTFMAGNADLAKQFAGFAVALAEQAIDRQDFRKVYDGPRSELTERLISGERARGRMETSQVLFYAKWINTGELDAELLEHSVAAAVELFDFNRGKEIPIDDMILIHLLAGRHANASDLFRRTWKQKQNLDLKEVTYRKNVNGLALVAAWQAGDPSLEHKAIEACDYWYLCARKWFVRDADFTLMHRLGWALLYKKPGSGTSERDSFFGNLRGC